MGTRLNKAIKVDSSMDFSLNRIIKWDNPLHSQIPMLWGYRVMIFLRWWKPWLLIQWHCNKMSCLLNRNQGQAFTT
jgi:hypothetical protein